VAGVSLSQMIRVREFWYENETVLWSCDYSFVLYLAV
jgi:hypothetical protein